MFARGHSCQPCHPRGIPACSAAFFERRTAETFGAVDGWTWMDTRKIRVVSVPVYLRRGSNRGKGSQSFTPTCFFGLPAPQHVWSPSSSSTPLGVQSFSFPCCGRVCHHWVRGAEDRRLRAGCIPYSVFFSGRSGGVLTNKIGHSAVPCRVSKEALVIRDPGVHL